MKQPKPLFVFPPNALTDENRKVIAKAGYLLLEVEKWNECKIVQAPAPLSVKGVERIAMAVILDPNIDGYSVHDVFRKRVLKAATEGYPRPEKKKS